MSGRPKQHVASDDRHIPKEYVGQLEPNYYCRGWNAKRQKYCKAVAGFRTDHPGVGRCFIHSGRAPIKHGRYSKILTLRLSELIDQYAEDTDPLDLHPELGIARALLQDYLERRGDDEDAEGLAEGIRLVEKISNIVEKIERIKAQHALTPDAVGRLMTNMGLVVRQFVPDQETCTQISKAWLELRV